MTLSQVKLPERPSFEGIFKDGTPVCNNNLEDLIQVPGIEYIVKIEFVNYNVRKFTLIKDDGSLYFLKIGEFELRDIGTEIYHFEHKADILIYDYREDQIRKIRIRTEQRATTMLRELLNLMNDLNKAGSYSLYAKLTRLNELEEENTKLREEISMLKFQLNGQQVK